MIKTIFGTARYAARPLAALMAALLASSCAELHEVGDLFSGDITPPSFEGIEMDDERRIILHFSEESMVETTSLTVSPELQIENVRSSSADVVIELAEGVAPGGEYTVHAVAEDTDGNRLSFLTRVYGYNPDVPGLIMNEFTTQGSGNHPDIVELLVTEAGNLGGATVYAGSRSDYDSKITLPPIPVSAGDYLLIHFKPEGIQAEVDEIDAAVDLSGGLNASDEARDFWVTGGTGLSGNNGTVSVYASPGGRLLDAVVYSNRTSDSDERYDGFGSKAAHTRVSEIVADGGWAVAGETAAPEDAINPDDSTATRSMNRTPGAADSDTKEDWHIGPTSSSSFGGENTTERYQAD